MTQTGFAIGQRWVSHAEPDLGLGIIIAVEGRVIRVLFPAVDEERAYANSNAPLSRLLLSVGDTTRSADNATFVIREREMHNAVATYQGVCRETGDALVVPETRLAHDLRIDSPHDRLFTNQFDANHWFELRHDALYRRMQLDTHALRGLLGARVAEIPHQLYIAHEVARRHQPRVMLADEVGLGKTIEAGLILHHQILTERAKSALVIVPPALLSQWVLELMRRFNLEAAIFDEERCAAAEESTGDNPFLSSQLVLCSLDFLTANPERAAQAGAVDWDLLVVDEAHHLHWDEDETRVSPEYRLVESLATSIPGLLLLTATPEQLGMSSHFARLRLIDPERFSDLGDFLEEQSGYAKAVAQIDGLLDAGDESALSAELDRHGTGRVLFRNTRAHIQGFPIRRLHAHPLQNPDVYEDSEHRGDANWVHHDARATWLLNFLRQRRQKVLVICAQQSTAEDLEQYLHFENGIRSAAFHEGLGLVARDRAAAWFAADDGAQALICSEIGSEGRNFQFAQHLVLFDLPGDPDLLEQRIGRLDRIGQQGEVNIHVPYLQDSPQELLYHWYQRGLNAFEKHSPANSTVHAEFREELDQHLAEHEAAAFEECLERGKARQQTLQQELEQGRDRLLELSSCRTGIAEALRAQLAGTNNDPQLLAFVERLCDCYGIDNDQRDESCFVLRPDTNYEEGFKDISPDGTAFTVDRARALSQEDLQFLSWEHPLITETMDRILGSHQGNTAYGVLTPSPIKPGTLLLECLFELRALAPRSLQLGRYLPAALIRVVVDHDLAFRDDELPFERTIGCVHAIPLERIKPILTSRKSVMEAMLKAARQQIAPQRDALIDRARQAIETQLLPERERLRYLQSINPNVRDSEIAALDEQINRCQSLIEEATLPLAAVRVLIAN